jgi:transcriptional regulator GlxA family with amidase domain
MERAFQEQVGLSQKLFGRLLRLEHALKLAETRSDWADVAVTRGYSDQSHLIRDFRAQTGATPIEFAALRAVPPRS